jgi:hypothetical protein
MLYAISLLGGAHGCTLAPPVVGAILGSVAMANSEELAGDLGDALGHLWCSMVVKLVKCLLSSFTKVDIS